MATRTWEGNGASTKNNLSIADNWSDDTLPTDGDTAVFGSCTTQPTQGTCDVGAGGTIQINAGADLQGGSGTCGTYTAGTITIGGNARIQGAIINGNPVVSYGRINSANSNNNITINGNLTFTPTNTCTLNLEYGNITISGNLTISASVYTVNFGTNAAATYTLSVGGEFSFGKHSYQYTTVVTAGAAAALASAVRTELATELGRIDAAITSRATPTNVSDATAALESYGDLHWLTAVGFSTLEIDDILDAVIETGITLKQALQIIGAAVAGPVSGARSGEETFEGLDGETTRITVICDSSGNRNPGYNV